MTLSHLWFRRFVDALVDGELDPARTRRVVHHVEGCADCGHDVRLTARVKRSLIERMGAIAWPGTVDPPTGER